MPSLICARLSLSIVLGAAAFPVGAAHAKDAAAARSHHDAGIAAYKAKRYDQAITEFTQAYELDPHPTLLFNLAQAHRQRGDAEAALSLYRRYLDAAPAAADREDTLRRIAELEREVARKAPPAPPAVVSAPPSPQEDVVTRSEPVLSAQPTVQQRPLRLSADAGVAIPFVTGGRAMRRPTLLATRLSGMWDLADDGTTSWGLGLAAAFSPVPYETLDTNEARSSRIVGLQATAAGRRTVDWLTVEGGVAAGVALWSGLGQGNPFTKDGQSASPVVMPTVRFSVGLLRVFPSWFVGVSPSLTLSKPMGSALDGGIDGFHSFAINASVGVRL